MKYASFLSLTLAMAASARPARRDEELVGGQAAITLKSVIIIITLLRN